MILYIIVPCYNEEEVFPWSLNKLLTLTGRLKAETDTDARLLFVDDGSRDRTWQLISEAAEANKEVAGLKLAHNVGHQNALWAGMEQALPLCDAMVSIDADLQDDETTIISMARQVKESVVNYAFFIGATNDNAETLNVIDRNAVGVCSKGVHHL